MHWTDFGLILSWYPVPGYLFFTWAAIRGRNTNDWRRNGRSKSVVIFFVVNMMFPMGNALDRLWVNFKLVPGTWVSVFSLGLLLGDETQTIGEETVVPSPL